MQTWGPHTARKGWGEGPWDDEPDKAQWHDEATGLVCLAVRQVEQGAWCGYVGVPPGHPAHGRHYDELGDLDCHGGLNFASGCDEDAPEGHGVCHVPAPGEPADVWWLGFDCSHVYDLQPGADAAFRAVGMAPIHERFPTAAYMQRPSYRTLGYVQAACARLAEQLAAMGTAVQ